MLQFGERVNSLHALHQDSNNVTMPMCDVLLRQFRKCCYLCKNTWLYTLVSYVLLSQLIIHMCLLNWPRWGIHGILSARICFLSLALRSVGWEVVGCVGCVGRGIVKKVAYSRESGGAGYSVHTQCMHMHTHHFHPHRSNIGLLHRSHL